MPPPPPAHTHLPKRTVRSKPTSTGPAFALLHLTCSFNLGVTKARVIKSMDDRAPLPFKRFYNSPLFDRLLNACLLYFTSRFMHE